MSNQPKINKIWITGNNNYSAHIQVTVLYQVLLATPQKVHNITLTILCNTLLNHSTQLQIKEIRINKYFKKTGMITQNLISKS